MDNQPSLGLSPNQAIETIWKIVFNLTPLIMWLTFAVFHLVLTVICLSFLWYFQVSPAQVAESFEAFWHTAFGSNALLVIGFAGLSGLALLLGYVKVWRKIYSVTTTKVLMKGL